ncbi:sulfite exporter TauE/SafE family protein [Undibacterium sp. TS12]|uniref:sulfite exporter TauE/SafE family protein n=1 Tax=Undibacterium sp. TS12 TaxID=2908202 RepID=UPI001F4CB99E|nr:sulfite exporter TauE/SafE family protein [Undibacterium sp. TS12]MCH8619966.1 sulfite exporter TauE/SafE family protein [Undibacterium sp. TS12]
MENLPQLFASNQHYLLVVLVFILAGMVKGVIGLGLPTIAIGLLSLSMPAMEAAALLIVPSLLTNIWQLGRGPQLILLLRRLSPMLLGICAGTFLSALLFHKINAAWSGLGLGLALIAYATMGLASIHWNVPTRLETGLSSLTGTLTGMVTATTGVFVMPSVPFLQALNLDKDSLIQAMGLSFTVSTLALAVKLASAGSLDWHVAGSSLFALLPALLGMQLGQCLRKKLQPLLFKRCFFIGLFGLGAHYLWGASA